MKKISDRINWYKKDNDLIIVIRAQAEQWKEVLLLLWLLIWSACGIYVFTQLFGEYPREQKLFLFIYLMFWLYFEYLIIQSYLWRKWGKELLKISEDQLLLKRDIKTYGKVNSYYIDNIKQLSKIERSKQSFAHIYYNSFWVAGGEVLSFNYLGKTITFGRQMTDAEASDLLRLLNSYIRKRT